MHGIAGILHFKLDLVTVGIVNVDRSAETAGSVHFHWPSEDRASLALDMRDEFVKIGLDAQAKVLDAARGGRRQGLARRHRDQIDQVAAAAYLVEPDSLKDALDSQPEHVLVEADRPLHVGHTKHDMVDAEERRRDSHGPTPCCQRETRALSRLNKDGLAARSGFLTHGATQRALRFRRVRKTEAGVNQ